MPTRALVSLYNKNGIGKVAEALSRFDIQILSTGGTARKITEAGVSVTEVAEVTGAAEYPEGLVKTLHPRIHFALLADRDNPEHAGRMAEDGIEPIDFVLCNLYDFASVADQDVDEDKLRSLIDIGGPTMIRAAAKNWKFVTAIVDPADYPKLIAELTANGGKTTPDFRRQMAAKAFSHTADYDALIDETLSRRFLAAPSRRLHFMSGKTLRYGENPHQRATLFLDNTYTGPNLARAEQLWGKELSYNNLVDGSAALEAILPYEESAVAVVKHTNPCGLATGETPQQALNYAWEGDIVSAFGSVIACNRTVTVGFMDFLSDKFVEMVIAPDFASDVLPWIESQKKKNLRLLAVGPLNLPETRQNWRFLPGMLLEQDEDDMVFDRWETMTNKTFPDNKEGLAKFALTAVKFVKSNEIVIAQEYAPKLYRVLAIGAGQPNRVDAIRKLAVPKALENLRRDFLGQESTTQSVEEYISSRLAECVLASGAFFPFADSIEVIAEVGIGYVVQPGGSMRDDEVVAAAEEKGIAMIFSGFRHFRH